MSIEPEDFTGRIVFMSMFNDISWGSKENERECELSAQIVSMYAKRCSPGKRSFLGPGSEKKSYSTHEYKPQGEWDRVAELMMMEFSESGHPVFPATSPLSRGTLKKQRWWPGRWGPQGTPPTGGGGPARVPNLRVCKHLLCFGCGTRTGGKDELTSCRGTV